MRYMMCHYIDNENDKKNLHMITIDDNRKNKLFDATCNNEFIFSFIDHKVLNFDFKHVIDIFINYNYIENIIITNKIPYDIDNNTIYLMDKYSINTMIKGQHASNIRTIHELIKATKCYESHNLNHVKRMKFIKLVDIIIKKISKNNHLQHKYIQNHNNKKIQRLNYITTNLLLNDIDDTYQSLDTTSLHNDIMMNCIHQITNNTTLYEYLTYLAMIYELYMHNDYIYSTIISMNNNEINIESNPHLTKVNNTHEYIQTSFMTIRKCQSYFHEYISDCIVNITKDHIIQLIDNQRTQEINDLLLPRKFDKCIHIRHLYYWFHTTTHISNRINELALSVTSYETSSISEEIIVNIPKLSIKSNDITDDEFINRYTPRENNIPQFYTHRKATTEQYNKDNLEFYTQRKSIIEDPQSNPFTISNTSFIEDLMYETENLLESSEENLLNN